MDTVSDRAILGEGTPESVWQHGFQCYPTPVNNAADVVGGSRTIHIVAPHPDDEILGCGGIIRQLARQRRTVRIWAVTDGEASHAGSARWTTSTLALTRTRESERALSYLGANIVRKRLAIPDGDIARHEDDLAVSLARSLTHDDTVLAPWRLDGHPDHEAAARASQRASSEQGCRFLEVPIWGWHWADPGRGDFPWDRAVRIHLSRGDMCAKARAIQVFRSQLEPDSSTGSPAILPDFALIRFHRPFEVVLR